MIRPCFNLNKCIFDVGRLKTSKKLADEADLKEVEMNINLIKPKPGKINNLRRKKNYFYALYSDYMKYFQKIIQSTSCNRNIVDHFFWKYFM